MTRQPFSLPRQIPVHVEVIRSHRVKERQKGGVMWSDLRVRKITLAAEWRMTEVGRDQPAGTFLTITDCLGQ